MIILIDNYDSFSYNLFQFAGAANIERLEVAGRADEVTAAGNHPAGICVIRNDAYTPEEIREMKPEAIIISPGPGRPEDAGICIEAIQKLGAEIPILGVCLGHQSICKAYGATVSYAKELMHGKQSLVSVDADCELFAGLTTPVKVARYHSLAAIEETMPECLKVVARSDDGEIMAVKHQEYPVYGVQFHPESVMTPDGMQMIRNFLKVIS